MAKSFKDKIQQKTVNPALQFLTQPEEDKPRRLEREAVISPQTVEGSKAKTKGSAATSTPRKAPQAKRAIPQFDEETKSRRLQLLLTPSLYEAVKDKAAEERMSVNEYINSILKDATRK